MWMYGPVVLEAAAYRRIDFIYKDFHLGQLFEDVVDFARFSAQIIGVLHGINGDQLYCT